MLCDNVSCDGLDFYEENHAEHCEEWHMDAWNATE